MQGVRGGENIAPVNGFPVQPLEIDGGAGPGRHRFHTVAMDLDAPDLGGDAGGKDHDIIPHVDLSRCQGAGDHRAEPFHGKHAIHGQPEDGGGRAGGDFVAEFIEDLLEIVKPFPGGGGHGNNGGIFQKGALGEFQDILHGKFHEFFIHQINFGHGNESVLDAHEGTDFHVLPGLGHDAFVGGNGHGDNVDAAGPGHHVFDKFFMARHIHNAHHFAAFQGNGCKPELYGDSPLFFFLESVGFNAGQGPDEAGFAMVNVACGAQYDLVHCVFPLCYFDFRLRIICMR